MGDVTALTTRCGATFDDQQIGQLVVEREREIARCMT
jgi:hypothetical protein